MAAIHNGASVRAAGVSDIAYPGQEASRLRQGFLPKGEGGDPASSLIPRKRDDAEEAGGGFADVAELMSLAWWDENRISDGDLRGAWLAHHLEAAREEEDFVLPGVLVQGSAASRPQLEEAHGEVGRALGAGEQPAHRSPARACFGHRLGLDLRGMDDSHP